MKINKEFVDKSTCTYDDSLFEIMFNVTFSFFKHIMKKEIGFFHENCMLLINSKNCQICMFQKGTTPPLMHHTHISNIKIFYDIHPSLPKDLREALDKKQIEAKYIPKKFKNTYILIVMCDLRGRYESRVYLFSPKVENSYILLDI